MILCFIFSRLPVSTIVSLCLWAQDKAIAVGIIIIIILLLTGGCCQHTLLPLSPPFSLSLTPDVLLPVTLRCGMQLAKHAHQFYA